MKYLMGLAVFCLIGYGALVAYLWAYQHKLMYFPDRNMETPEAYGLQGFSSVMLTAADGVNTVAWVRAPQENMPVVVYYHGNGGNLGHRKTIYNELVSAGFGVIALSYRGYGTSEGQPGEEGFYADARASLRYATETLGVPLPRIILFGESLGTSVAVKMASEQPVGGVVLEAPFTSVTDRASEIYFFVPVARLLKDRFDSLARVKEVKAPLLILHGEKDAIIPVRMGRALFEAANEPKRAVFYPAIGHNDFDEKEIVKELLQFTQDNKI